MAGMGRGTLLGGLGGRGGVHGGGGGGRAAGKSRGNYREAHGTSVPERASSTTRRDR